MQNDTIEDLLYKSGLTAQGCWDELDEYAKEGIIRVIKMTVKECANVIHKRIGPKSAVDVLEHFGIEE